MAAEQTQRIMDDLAHEKKLARNSMSSYVFIYLALDGNLLMPSLQTIRRGLRAREDIGETEEEGEKVGRRASEGYGSISCFRQGQREATCKF
jgi:hypothetical protein